LPPPPPPASRNARTCCTASTLQPQASELPCSATASPSMMVAGSPSTIGNVPWCFGQLALSLTRATGFPSISVNGEPVTTCPPLLVASPTTAHILVMHPFLGKVAGPVSPVLVRGFNHRLHPFAVALRRRGSRSYLTRPPAPPTRAALPAAPARAAATHRRGQSRRSPPARGPRRR